MSCPKLPSIAYPLFLWRGQSVSQPVSQNSQAPHADHSQALPTTSPSASLVTPSPRPTTVPTPSWPGMKGGLGLAPQSPCAACRSVWQTPEASNLTRT